MRAPAVSLLCLAILFCGIISAQDDSSFQKAQDLCNEGNEAFNDKDYEKAVESFLEAVSYPEIKDWKSNIFYAISCGYSLLGEAEKAFEYLDSAAATGYTDYRQMNADSDFDFLRENNKSRFDNIISRVKSVKSEEIRRKTPIYISEYDNYNGPLEISEYDWRDIDNPQMDTLRTEYKLHEVIGNDGTEFDRMKRLLNWVATRWKHDGSKMAPERNALSILREVEKGKRFCCANYADVLIGCMRSLGYPIRFVGLRTEDAAYYMGGGHGCVEVWSNQYQKWILLDVQNNAWWEHDGTPLSAYECHRLFIDGREDELDFVGQHEGQDYVAAKPLWSVYFYRVTNYWMGESIQLVSDGIAPELIYQLYPQNLDVTDQFDRVYPRLNQTTITLRNDNADSLGNMTVILSHTMPYFDRFVVQIDGDEWGESADTISWVLHDDANTIEAKAVNTAGIEGRTSRITVQSNLGESN